MRAHTRTQTRTHVHTHRHKHTQVKTPSPQRKENTLRTVSFPMVAENPPKRQKRSTFRALMVQQKTSTSKRSHSCHTTFFASQLGIETRQGPRLDGKVECDRMSVSFFRLPQFLSLPTRNRSLVLAWLFSMTTGVDHQENQFSSSAFFLPVRVCV